MSTKHLQVLWDAHQGALERYEAARAHYASSGVDTLMLVTHSTLLMATTQLSNYLLLLGVEDMSEVPVPVESPAD